MDFTIFALTFGAIFIVELPDKTFIAALVLSTRYRPLLVWLGVGLAFFLQVLIAVTAGQLATLLPEIQIKAAGGIRSHSDALALLQAGASRIGTSAGVAIVEESRKL